MLSVWSAMSLSPSTRSSGIQYPTPRLALFRFPFCCAYPAPLKYEEEVSSMQTNVANSEIKARLVIVRRLARRPGRPPALPTAFFWGRSSPISRGRAGCSAISSQFSGCKWFQFHNLAR